MSIDQIVFDPLLPWPAIWIAVMLFDIAVILAAFRRLSGWWLRGLAGVALLAALLLAAGSLAAVALPTRPALADDARAVEVTAETYLAYVQTGDSTVDNLSRAGLEGLVDVLTRLTAG